MNSRAEIINYIMNLEYWDYACPWCKIQLFTDIPRRLRNKDLFIPLLENVLTNYTPEDFRYNDMMDSQWKLSENAEHVAVIDNMLSRLDIKKEKRRKESEESGIAWNEEKEEDDPTFSDYPTLKELFLTKVFDEQSVQFFINVLPENMDAFWDEGKMPAVIGIDDQCIGIFWWMD